MPDEEWHYLENQFDNSTKDSYKRAKQQAQFHADAAPNAPGGIAAALGNRLAAAKTPFDNAYNLWVQKRGQLKGATQAYSERLDQFAGEDIEEIETAFKGGFKRGTPEHTSAFPQGREPFQQGGGDARVTALGNLKTRCEELIVPLQTGLQNAQNNNEPQAVIDEWQLRVFSMSAARDKAQAAHTALSGLRTLQNDLETEVDLARTAIEPLRVALGDALYTNLAQLMMTLNTGALRPQIAAFFDLDILRETGPEEEEPPVIPPVPPPGP
jgi:hypothetical protein